jgi:hypothetical protein
MAKRTNIDNQNLFNEAAKAASTVNKGDDKGFINPESKATVVTKGSGAVVLNSGLYAQYKCDKNSGKATEISMHSSTTTVQKELTASDIIINRHKLNTQLIEFSNLVSNMNTIMGGLTVNSTVLVKAWEPTLEKYVLIRRPARFALFGNLLDAYVVDDRLHLDKDYSEDILELKRTLNDFTKPKGDNNES